MYSYKLFLNECRLPDSIRQPSTNYAGVEFMKPVGNQVLIGEVTEFSMPDKKTIIVATIDIDPMLIKLINKLDYVMATMTIGSKDIIFNAKVANIEIVSKATFVGNVENPNKLMLSVDCIFYFSEVTFK